MPRFVLDVENGPEHEIDAPDLAQAKCEALRFAGSLICDSADTFWDVAHFRMTVADEAGLILFALELIGTEAPAVRSLKL